MATKPKTLLGDLPAGWGFTTVERDNAVEQPAPIQSDLRSTIDAGWLDHTRRVLAAFIREAAPDDDGYSIALCEWMTALLCEYMEKGISLDDLILCARKAAARMPVANADKYLFVGVIASAATSAAPERTHTGRQGKTSQVLVAEAMRLVYINQRDEDGQQVMTTDEAVEAARDTLIGLLSAKLVPSKKTMKNQYSAWLANQGADVSRPRIGTPTFKK